MTYVPSYEAVHKRLRKARGVARDHLCAFGCGRQAEHWAYDGQAEDEIVNHYRYSLDFSHYRPLCRPCHALDHKRQGRVPS